MSLFDRFRRKPATTVPPQESPKTEKKGVFSGFSTHKNYTIDPAQLSKIAFPVQGVQRVDPGTGKAMDEACDVPVNNKPYRFTSGASGVPLNIMGWFLSQGFIGYQMCSVMAQNWVINRACKIPAEDACRNGWRISGIEDGRLKEIEALDKEWKLKRKVEEFIRFNRVFGIRIALFVVESDDPLYYEKPFNIDGVQPGSYRGISQIDPVWCSGELESDDVSDPTSCNFYEPTYWRLGTRRVHRSHLVIIRYSEVPDLLKPTYNYGGLPLPQLIWERVYGAERGANEGPQLLLTKRMNVIATDLETAQADPERFQDKVLEAVERRDNYGVWAIDKEADEYSQHETALADVDAVIMTGYQLVAAVAEIPSTKLLGTSPKGFNPTGDFETAAYRETLASVQEHHGSPLLERHYMLAQKSLFGEVVDFDIAWNPLDEPTEKEQADTNLVRAQEAQIWQSMGVVSQEQAEAKLRDDESAGWSQYMNEESEDNGGSTEEDRALAAAIQSLIAREGVQPPAAQTDPVDEQRGGGFTQPQQ